MDIYGRYKYDITMLRGVPTQPIMFGGYHSVLFISAVMGAARPDLQVTRGGSYGSDEARLERGRCVKSPTIAVGRS